VSASALFGIAAMRRDRRRRDAHIARRAGGIVNGYECLLAVRRREAVAVLRRSAEALDELGTPLLLLDPQRVRAQHRRLRAALPFVRFHYAVKALPHAAVIDSLSDEGAGFDIATSEELACVLARGVEPGHIIDTHPVKKPEEIERAMDAGIRTFVVDNVCELEKFRGAAGVRLLVRLAYRSPHAGSDLSSKFGVAPSAARALVEHALGIGVPIAGFSFHVGSQLDDARRFAGAVAQTLDLMDELERTLPVRFEVLDIGGGFPVAYHTPVASLEEVGAALRPLLEPRANDLDIIAEPGRIMVAEAMTLVTSVVGVADRPDGRWYYLDDGLYGSYSNVLTEDVHPPVFAVRDLETRDAGPRMIATVAGPTCDSSDVIVRGLDLPELAPGDLLVSPVMGAYTSVTSSRFNGRPPTPIAVLADRPAPAVTTPIETVR
jgi:ornithine decarboxylase